jgi:hypothetical protein
MPLRIVGAGVGRTGTLSLKTALEQLGFGPCFHCLEGPLGLIARAMSLALNRQPVDWDGIFAGYNAAVDEPFSMFYRDIAEKCPSARFILTVRDPNSWFESTKAARPHLRAVAPPTSAPVESAAHRPTLSPVIPPEFAEILKFESRESVLAAFERFNRGVQNAIPSDRLLVFDVKQGWQPLCEFLGVPIPEAPFPHVNSIQEFPSRLGRMVEREYAKR